jgi:acid phosphatase type 7
VPHASIALLAALGSPQAKPSIVAGPYLQLASTPGSVVVQFIQSGEAPIKVTSGSSTVKFVGAEKLRTPGLRTVKFLINGVAENFKYSVTADGKTLNYSGKGSPRTQKVRFTIFGDSGRGLPGQFALAKQIDKFDSNLIVHVGDIVYPNGRESEYLKFHFPVYGKTLSRIPSVAAAGNHDTAYRDLKRYPDGLAYYKVWHIPQNKQKWSKDVGNFSFTYGNTFWVILDSNTYNNWKGADAQNWLRSELKKGQSAAWRFVAFHHAPYHSSNKKKDEIYMQAIAPILEVGRVNAVFCGHVHNYQRTRFEIQKPTYFVTGAGGAELYDQKIAADPSKWRHFTATYLPGYSFTGLEVDGTKAIVRQIDLKGRTIDSVELRSY